LLLVAAVSAAACGGGEEADGEREPNAGEALASTAIGEDTVASPETAVTEEEAEPREATPAPEEAIEQRAAPAPPIEAPALDACSLLTQSEAAELLEEAVEPASRGLESEGDAEHAAASRCGYTAVESKRSVSLFARQAPTDDNRTSSIAGTRETAALGGELKEVAGLGDEAFAVQEPEGVALHVFWGGNRYMIVGIGGIADADDALARARRLAERVMGRL
jgi:hypothetical protein